MNHPLLTLEVDNERDIVAARQRARQVSALLGCDAQDQVRIATAVSELARNAVRYADRGSIDFSVEVALDGAAQLTIVIRDQGPGIPDIEEALRGQPQAAGETRMGLIAAQRMMDTFNIESMPGKGARITLGKAIPKRAGELTTARIAAVARELAARQRVDDPHAEIQQQNRELVRSLEELRERQDELTRLNAELEDTNRGVMALYAELDERATQLRRADETKSRFLSNVSHEFRTPVNSILALTQILLHRLDGTLSVEQEKQVGYIRQAAEQLCTLIDDLLDLRKVESGKIEFRIESFSALDLFGALRGMFKPLAKPGVALQIVEPANLPMLHTDHGKLSQILRNLISNALKFTARGSVRLSARLRVEDDSVEFVVSDTGVGIAPENYRRIFEEFTQVENPLQRGIKGTGLGLALSQRLAALLGGNITVQSALGEGSVFTLAIPRVFEAGDAQGAQRKQNECVLIIDDNEMERYALRQFLSFAAFDVIEAEGGYDGLRLARQHHPNFIFLDLAMPDIHGFEVLTLLKAAEATRNIPIVIFTSYVPEDADRENLQIADALLMKNELSRESVANVMRRLRETHGEPP